MTGYTLRLTLTDGTRKDVSYHDRDCDDDDEALQVRYLDKDGEPTSGLVLLPLNGVEEIYVH